MSFSRFSYKLSVQRPIMQVTHPASSLRSAMVCALSGTEQSFSFFSFFLFWFFAPSGTDRTCVVFLSYVVECVAREKKTFFFFLTAQG